MIRYSTWSAITMVTLALAAFVVAAADVDAQQSPQPHPDGRFAGDFDTSVWKVSNESALRFGLLPRVTEARPTGVFDGPIAIGNLISYALANNPEIRSARFYAQSLGARVPQANSLPDPRLLTTTFLEKIQTAAGPEEVALSLSQKFPWFGKLALRGQVAYYDSIAAYSRAAAVELKVIEQVKRAYFDLYFAQSAADENRRLEKPLKDVIAVAKTKYETSVGNTGLQDVFQSQVELSKLKINLVKLDEAKRQAQARIAGLLHLPPRTRIEALGAVRRSEIDNSVENLIGLAEARQPEFEAFRRELSRDQSSIELARRGYWPDVTMSLNWYEMGNGGISPVANGQDAFSIGVGVNLPIYRSRLDGAVREAQNKRSTTACRYTVVRDQFQTEIQTLYAEFREHHQTLRILETEVIPRAEEALKLTMEAYRADRANFEQLMDVYRTLLRYRIDLHRQMALREQTVASLERAVGTAVTSPVQADADRSIEQLSAPVPLP